MNFPAISQLMILNRRGGGGISVTYQQNYYDNAKIIYIYIYMLSLGQDPIT